MAIQKIVIWFQISDHHIADSNDNNLQASHQNHHSSPGTTSMLHVHSTTQLEVILPISSTPEPHISTSNSTHSTTTRLKSGAIDKKNYAAMLVSFPELQSLQVSDQDMFIGGYSLTSEITNIQEEYDSLRA